VLVHGMAGRYTLAGEAVERSSAHARLAGNARLAAGNSTTLALFVLHGPTPVAQAIAQCEQQIECAIMSTLAQLKAMNGELEAARDLCRRARTVLRDLGKGVFAASTGLDLARVELHGGDLAAAEREVREDYDFLAKVGETYVLSTMAALLSRLVRDQGRDDEALALSKIAEQASAADDVESQALWRAIRAPIVARGGELVAAEELARGALEFARRAEAPCMQADAMVELAEVLRLSGLLDAARTTLSEALALYTAKGDVVSAARASALARDLGSG
jgi:ATP/maltotriose-dependent transcriptional regulator MalT